MPSHLCKSRDVLPATSDLHASTPQPFGIGVYAWPQHKAASQKKLQLLLYVSDQVARDRSPAAHVWNGTGVRAGWYLIAQPGTHFEVCATRVNRVHAGFASEDGLLTSLIVDGTDTNRQHFFRQDEGGRDVWGGDAVYDGFLERRVIETGGKEVRNEVRPFVFRKVCTSDTEIESSDVGTIRLMVSAGYVRRVGKVWGDELTYEFEEAVVGEKIVAKEGRTINVKHDEPVAKSVSRFGEFTVVDTRDLPEAEVTTFVREASWMRSRRLIDNDGHPCTYGMYQKLLKLDNLPLNPIKVKTLDRGRAKKRQKVKEEAIVDRHIKSASPKVKEEGAVGEDIKPVLSKVKEEAIVDEDVKPVLPGEIVDLT